MWWWGKVTFASGEGRWFYVWGEGGTLWWWWFVAVWVSLKWTGAKKIEDFSAYYICEGYSGNYLSTNG